jgi:UDP-glucuronate 4-epimerase
MKILVTGAAGFIGFHTCLKLVSQGHDVYGIDNINDYYDPKLKFDRLNELGFNEVESKLFKNEVQSAKFNSLRFSRIDLVDYESIDILFKQEQFEVVCNLAAQAGVRYSIENPKAYIDSNISGFLNILECCRHNEIKHLLYASSSSVYGANKKVPFFEKDSVDHPISLYAATKKSNELMAHTYSHLYNIPTTGLRFFTVYGPWGRPDMAPMLFADAISNNRSIDVFNHGDMSRDFTYIDDIVSGIELLLDNPPKIIGEDPLYRIFNIGNGNPQSLEDFINALELNLSRVAKKKYLPMQPGDVPKTWADISKIKELGYQSKTTMKDGVSKFILWFQQYFNK